MKPTYPKNEKEQLIAYLYERIDYLILLRRKKEQAKTPAPLSKSDSLHNQLDF